MSSVRELDRAAARETQGEREGEWTPIQSPRKSRPAVTASDVSAAIAGARARYRLGTQQPSNLDEMTEYGGGDAELADDISDSVASFWDQ